MRKYWLYFQRHCFSVTLLLASCILFLTLMRMLAIPSTIQSFLKAISPLLIGVVIALFMHPFIIRCRFISAHKWRVTFVYGLFVFSVGLFFVFLIPLLYTQAKKVIQNSDQLFSQLENIVQAMGLEKFYEQGTQAVVETSSELSIDLLFSGADHLTQFFFSFFIAYFISLEIDVFVNEFKKLFIQHEKWLNFYRTFSSILSRYVKGVLLDTLFIVITAGLLLWVFHFPQPFFLALLLAVFNLLPYIGAFIGVGIIVLVGILSFGSIPWLAIVLLILLQQIEGNIVHPLILNKAMSVHPLYLFAALLISEFLFGFIGIIFSPLLAAFLQIGVGSYMHVLNNSNVGGWEDIFIK